METLRPKKKRIVNFFPTGKFCWLTTFSSNSLCKVLHNYMCPYYICSTWSWSLDNGIEGIIQLVKNFLTNKIFRRKFSVALINLILPLFIVTMEIQSNLKMKWNRKQDLRSVIKVQEILHISYHTYILNW